MTAVTFRRAAQGYTLFRDTPDFSACDSFGGGRRLLLGEPSANTPYPLARTFAPPPHCRRTNRGGFVASTTRCRRYKTLSTLFRHSHSHVAYFVICEHTIVDGHIVDHAGIADALTKAHSRKHCRLCHGAPLTVRGGAGVCPTVRSACHAASSMRQR